MKYLLVTIILFCLLLVSGCTNYDLSKSDGNSHPIPDEGFVQLGEEFDDVYYIYNAGDKLSFEAIIDNKTYIFYDGKIVTPGFEDISRPYVYGDHFGYAVPNCTEEFGPLGEYISPVCEYSIYIDGVKLDRVYNDFEFFNFGEDLAVIGRINESFYLYKDGAEQIMDYEHVRIQYPKWINGKFTYKIGMNCTWEEEKILRLSNCENFNIVHGNTTYGEDYDWVGEPFTLYGKLAYEAEISYPNGSSSYEIMRENSEYIINCSSSHLMVDDEIYCYDINIDERYFGVSELAVYDGELFYRVWLNPYTELAYFVYGNREFGREYDSVDDHVWVNGEFAYLAANASGFDGKYVTYDKKFIVYKGRELGKMYDRIERIISVGSKLAYLAEKDGRSYVIIEE